MNHGLLTFREYKDQFPDPVGNSKFHEGVKVFKWARETDSVDDLMLDGKFRSLPCKLAQVKDFCRSAQRKQQKKKAVSVKTDSSTAQTGVGGDSSTVQAEGVDTMGDWADLSDEAVSGEASRTANNRAVSATSSQRKRKTRSATETTRKDKITTRASKKTKRPD